MFPSAVFTKPSFCFLSSLNLETPGRRLLYMLDRMPNWVDLPNDLLERIRDCCPILDQIQMQLVCKPWWSTLKHAYLNEPPWLMMLPNNKSEEEENPPPDVDARLFYSLSKKQIHTIPLPEIRGKRCCGSLQNGWLMIVDDKLDISLFHPWSKKKKKVDLPPHSTFKRDIFERGIYHIRSAISDDGNVLVFLYGFGQLAFWREGNAAYTDSGIDELMDDVIYHKGQFYASSEEVAVYLLHVEEVFPPRREKLTLRREKLTLSLKDFPIYYWQHRYLVPDILTDSMFVIARKVVNSKTNDFDIYRVSLEQGSHDKKLKEFTKEESLGDCVVFLGYNYPIVMARQFPGLKGNCIYFTDNIVDSFDCRPDACYDLGVFNLKDGTVEELFADRLRPAQSPPLWIAAPPYISQRDFGEN